MQKIRVGVLRGGPSNEYEVSLKTGATVLKHLSEDVHDLPPDSLHGIYDVQDILISRDGTWHKNGTPIAPHDAIAHVDVIFNALHGHYGEDGKLQHFLEMHGVPFTGSASFPSAIGMNKVLSKEVFKKEGIRTPDHFVLREVPTGDITDLFRTFSPPVVVKPVSAGSSVGISLVKTPATFLEAIRKAFEHSDTVMLEEYIPGVEATVGVIDGYRGSALYALPPIEIRPHKEKGKAFYDYEAKYEDKSDIIVPSTFTKEQKLELEDLARRAHEALGLRHYSRTDFIVSPRRGIYVLEVNTLPGLTDHSCVPKALGSIGAPLSHFLDHVLQLALAKK